MMSKKKNKKKNQAAKYSLIPCCMPVKSRSHRIKPDSCRPSSLTFWRAICPHLWTPSVHEAERYRTTGCKRCRKRLKRWPDRQCHKGRDLHFHTHPHTSSSSSSHTPDRDLLFTGAAGGSELRMGICVCVLIKHSSPFLRSSQCLVTQAPLFFPFRVWKERTNSFIFNCLLLSPAHRQKSRATAKFESERRENISWTLKDLKSEVENRANQLRLGLKALLFTFSPHKLVCLLPLQKWKSFTFKSCSSLNSSLPKIPEVKK